MTMTVVGTRTTGARIRRASPTDRELLADFLRRLSPESAYLRFLTVITGRSDPLLTNLLPDDTHGGALLAFVDDGLAGHAMWGLRAPGIADLGIVVLDEHQRCGVGTALARALMVELAARGIEEAEVYSSAGNRAVARMVARQAPDASHELDGPTLTFRFHVPALRTLNSSGDSMAPPAIAAPQHSHSIDCRIQPCSRARRRRVNSR